MSTVSGCAEIDAYIGQFPVAVQRLLTQVRDTVRSAIPHAEEVMRYGIPTLRLKTNLLHYAAFENHIGLYPTPVAMQHFAAELRGYVQGKGSVQFPLDVPLPLDLIARIAEFRGASQLPVKVAVAKAAGKSSEKAVVKSPAKKAAKKAATKVSKKVATKVATKAEKSVAKKVAKKGVKSAVGKGTGLRAAKVVRRSGTSAR
jgi:uncharacterized protein YdhG (YjbR/CyaY superfamily)